MEEVCERENLKKALKRVRSNKGSPGIDGMTVDELPGYLYEAVEKGEFRVDLYFRLNAFSLHIPGLREY
jgi:hypothetical protein